MITAEALAALLPPHPLGVPCGKCNARAGHRCTTDYGERYRPKAHAARERRAWHVRAWLFTEVGIDANEART